MKKKYLLFLVLLLCFSFSNTYSQEKMFYGTIETNDALRLKKIAPTDIKIISSKNGFSAVKLSDFAAEKLHHMILTHGPGFIYESSEKDALKTINSFQNKKAKEQRTSYTITESQLVNQGLNLINNTNIANHIAELENYGTRYHTTQKAIQSVQDLKQKWQAMANGRSDVSIRIVNHNSTSMPSVIMTIQGSELPNEYVIIGGHIDSVSPERDTNAPGADDNASGIATITEVARVLFQMNFQPKRTIEFMAFAAEEVGLRGSKEIAQDYKNRNINVLSYVQFDMTNYKGSAKDVYISDDSYNSSTLNTFLTNLMDYYNASGNHQFTYDYTRCNYGCSDHYSWAQQGYDAAFPFEASFNDSNPYIHTVNDRSSRFPTANATHAAKFAKLGLEYLIEVAKNKGGDTQPTYCDSKANNVNDEYIQNVTLGSINNNSTATNGYQDFTSMSTNLAQGSSNTITIKPKWSSSVYNEGYAVWIDYNQDYDFDDSGEQVWVKNASTDTSINGTFTVPNSAKLGTTRMRVAMQYNAIPNSCGSFNYGEVEDYSIEITEENTSTNICEGVAEYSSSRNYEAGDRVVYYNVLYERTSNGWNNLGNCSNAKNTEANFTNVLVNDKDVIAFAPNPVEKNTVSLAVKNDLWQYKDVLIYTMNGRLVKTLKMNIDTKVVDVSDLPAGIYLVSLSNSSKTFTQQLVKK